MPIFIMDAIQYTGGKFIAGASNTGDKKLEAT
jgi:hypothetical protein